MHIIVSNFGNESIALIQWAAEQQLTDVTVLSIETGWSAPEWPKHVERCQSWVSALNMTPVRLEPKVTFKSLVQTQGNLPSRKFQWCANFLKALPLLEWLDSTEVDPSGEAIILLARRRSASRINFDLPEWIDEEEKLGDRKVWHPLYQHDTQTRDELIKQAGFDVMPHRSLECDPCVNSDLNDVLRMDLSVIERTARLETELDAQLLDPSIYHGQKTLLEAVQHLEKSPKQNNATTTDSNEIFDMGCGNSFGCGL